MCHIPIRCSVPSGLAISWQSTGCPGEGSVRGSDAAKSPRFIIMLLSGVFNQFSAMPLMLLFIAYLMPLTYTVEGLRQSFSDAQAAWSPLMH